MKQNSHFGKFGKIETPFKRVNLLCLLFTIVILLSNIVSSLYFRHEPLTEFISNSGFWGLIPFIGLLLILQFSQRYEAAMKVIHILIFLSASLLDIQSDYDSPFGLLFWFLAIVLTYGYGLLKHHKFLKTGLLCIFLIVNVQTSAVKHGKYMHGIMDLIVFSFFLTLLYLTFKDELDKIFRQELKYKNRYSKLVQDKKILEDKIEKYKAELEELEIYYQEYINKKEPFDLSKYRLTDSEEELIHMLVTTSDNYREISQKLNRTEASIKQSVYRINNKIGTETRLQICQLFQFNWPESAGKF